MATTDIIITDFKRRHRLDEPQTEQLIAHVRQSNPRLANEITAFLTDIDDFPATSTDMRESMRLHNAVHSILFENENLSLHDKEGRYLGGKEFEYFNRFNEDLSQLDRAFNHILCELSGPVREPAMPPLAPPKSKKKNHATPSPPDDSMLGRIEEGEEWKGENAPREEVHGLSVGLDALMQAAKTRQEMIDSARLYKFSPTISLQAADIVNTIPASELQYHTGEPFQQAITKLAKKQPLTFEQAQAILTISYDSDNPAHEKLSEYAAADAKGTRIKNFISQFSINHHEIENWLDAIENLPQELSATYSTKQSPSWNNAQNNLNYSLEQLIHEQKIPAQAAQHIQENVQRLFALFDYPENDGMNGANPMLVVGYANNVAKELRECITPDNCRDVKFLLRSFDNIAAAGMSASALSQSLDGSDRHHR